MYVHMHMYMQSTCTHAHMNMHKSEAHAHAQANDMHTRTFHPHLSIAASTHCTSASTAAGGRVSAHRTSSSCRACGYAHAHAHAHVRAHARAHSIYKLGCRCRCRCSPDMQISTSPGSFLRAANTPYTYHHDLSRCPTIYLVVIMALRLCAHMYLSKRVVVHDGVARVPQADLEACACACVCMSMCA